MSQVWLITGSSRGLGRAFTEAVLAARHRVLAAARNPDQLADLHAGAVKRFIAPLSMSPVAVKRGTATSEAILKRYNSDNVAHPAYKAFAEVGKAEKDASSLRLSCLARGSTGGPRGTQCRRELERDQGLLCCSRQGELTKNSREQKEAVTLSLQLLQNCLVLINTLLVERTIEREGLWERLTTEDLRALTPLFHGHINPYGQFELDLARPSFLEAA
jgi:hypothetical protein